MTFIVILVVLLIERFFDWSHLRYWQGYIIYQNKVQKLLQHTSPFLILFLSVASLLMITLLIVWMIQGWLYGFIKLIFDMVVLLYCLGPRNLWADAFSSMNALSREDFPSAQEQLRLSFSMRENKTVQLAHQQLLSKIFTEANGRVFAVLIWFIIAGPVGAILYRTISLTAKENAEEAITPDLSSKAFLIEKILDWLPIRLLVLLFALSGHFMQVVACIRTSKQTVRQMLLDLNNNQTWLVECGEASLGYQESLPEDGRAESHAIGLLDRTFVITLVIIAMMAWLI